jgi:hypothetical protein
VRQVPRKAEPAVPSLPPAPIWAQVALMPSALSLDNPHPGDGRSPPPPQPYSTMIEVESSRRRPWMGSSRDCGDSPVVGQIKKAPRQWGVTGRG